MSCAPIASFSCPAFSYQIFLCKNASATAPALSKLLQPNSDQPQGQPQDLQYLFINPSLLFSLNLLPLAISKALLTQSSPSSTLKTRSLTTEVLYNLSPSTGISASLKSLGFNAELQNVLLVVFGPFQRREIPLCEWGTLDDYLRLRRLDLIKKAFGVEERENDQSFIEGVIQNALAIKDL